MPKKYVVVAMPEGLFCVAPSGERVPLGTTDADDNAVILVPEDPDDRTVCDHCSALFSIGNEGDNDDRCGRCKKSHRECGGCDRMDAEACIHCGWDWCEACWTEDGHVKSCGVTAREVRRS